MRITPAIPLMFYLLSLFFISCEDQVNDGILVKSVQKVDVIDYYRGGYDESKVGGNLVVMGCTLTNSGTGEENGILLNSYGSSMLTFQKINSRITK